MAHYMLLLYDDPTNYTKLKPEDFQKAFGKFFAWHEKLIKDGIYVDSHKLRDEPGRVLRGKGAQLKVSDGPYSETKEVLGGYFTVSPPNYEKACEIARGCPSLEYGGTVEVREVEVMPQQAKVESMAG